LVPGFARALCFVIALMSHLLALFRRVARRFSLTAAAVAAVFATLVPSVASAQRQQVPGPDTKKVLVTVFRGDRDAGQKVADEIRNRIAGGFDIRSLMPTSKQDIESTLSCCYRSDSAFSPNDIKELAKLVHADEVIDGTITKSGTGFKVTARMFLPRDVALSQPLVTDSSVTDLGDAAAAIIGEYALARAQLPSNRACETAIGANQNAVAIAAAREGIRKYHRAVLLRLCMSSAYANMKSGVDSTQPWRDSVIAITRDVLKLDKSSRIAYQLQYDVYKSKHDTANALAALAGLRNSGGINAPDISLIDPPFVSKAEVAVPTARQLVEDNPGDPQYARTYWLVLRAARNYKDAVPAGVAYVALDTAAADSNYFFRQVSDLQADSAFAKAAQMAAIGVTKFPKSTALLLLKAQNERRAGQLAAAKASLQRALEIDPTVSRANFLLASISAEMGDANDAMKYAKADAAADPANKARAAAVLLQLGNAQYRVASTSKTPEDYKKAIHFLQASDELLPSANAKFLLGVSAFQAIAASIDALKASKSCEDFKQASDLLSIVNNNMPAGGFVDVNTMKQIMESAVQYASFFEGSIKKYCQ
jgi:tetratricopeptide (TPR) repeat protein